MSPYFWYALIFHLAELADHQHPDRRINRLIAEREKWEKAALAETMKELSPIFRGRLHKWATALQEQAKQAERAVESAKGEAWRAIAAVCGVGLWHFGKPDEQMADDLIERIAARFQFAMNKNVGPIVEAAIKQVFDGEDGFREGKKRRIGEWRDDENADQKKGDQAIA
jgi:hypothetical protein